MEKDLEKLLEELKKAEKEYQEKLEKYTSEEKNNEKCRNSI